MILAGQPTQVVGPSLKTMHDEVDEDADLTGELSSGDAEVGHFDAVVSDAGVNVGELVASSRAERAADFKESPPIVSSNHIGHGVEKRSVSRQPRPERRQRILCSHVDDDGSGHHEAAFRAENPRQHPAIEDAADRVIRRRFGHRLERPTRRALDRFQLLVVGRRAVDRSGSGAAR